MEKMIDRARFDNSIILGTSLGGKFAAVALSKQLPILSMVGDPLTQIDPTRISNLTGKSAHSHIFLPRLKRDLQAIAPEFVSAMETAGLRFIPGSRYAWARDLAVQRLYATRWQLENFVSGYVGSHVKPTVIENNIVAFERDEASGAIRRLEFSGGEHLDIAPNTLVVDCLGATSRLMRSMLADAQTDGMGVEGYISEPAHVGYASHFFRLNPETNPRDLPDSCTRCSGPTSDAFIAHYPALDGWFTVTVAFDTRVTGFLKKLRSTDDLISYITQRPDLAEWIRAAQPVGSTHFYLGIRNTWAVPLLSQASAPANYVALGDALVCTDPTLGAGTSYIATHVRALCENLRERCFSREGFLDTIRREQWEFFKQSVETPPPALESQPATSNGRKKRWSFSRAKKAWPIFRGHYAQRTLRAQSTLLEPNK